MDSAFWFLIRRSTRNLIRVRLKRMRQPRYAIGTVFGLLYFGWIFGGAAGGGFARLGASRDLVELIATGLLFLFVAVMWLWPSKKGPALGFTPAEVQFLFPAPLSRSQLIWYRITRTQIAVLVSATLFALMARPSTMAGFVAVYLGMCLTLGALGFHSMGVSLGRENLSKGGWRAMVRHRLPMLVILAVAGAITLAVGARWADLRSLPDWTTRLRAANEILSTGVAGVALWPIRALVRLPQAREWTAILWALPPALLIWAVNAIWVVRSDAAFEEASAEQSEKIAMALQGKAPVQRPNKRQPPFALSPTGRPEIAILWKNAISVSRVSRAALITWGVIVTGLVAVVMFSVGSGEDRSQAIGFVVLSLAFMSLMNGPLASRADLREDLAHLAVLKTWPIRGAALVRGEVLVPTLLCTAVTSTLLAIAAAIGGRALPESVHATPAVLAWWSFSAMLLTLGVIAVQVVVQNAVAVFFPAWTRVGPRTAGSVEGMGRQMLMVFGSLLVLPIACIPAGLAAALAWFGLQWTLGGSPVLIPAVVATAVLLTECWIATAIIGAALDRTDISAVDPA